MPLYDYRCQACGHLFETLVRANSTPACPQCSSASLEKLMSPPTAPGKSKAIMAANRAKAARAGHLSNYARAEQKKLPR
jgi:putative FmdB family regulatory protein